MYTLREQAPFINSGGVDVQQKSLAFKLNVQDEEAEMMYVREESKLLWEMLNKAVDDKHNLSVAGPPGTGKSTEVWAWALWHANDKGAWAVEGNGVGVHRDWAGTGLTHTATLPRRHDGYLVPLLQRVHPEGRRRRPHQEDRPRV
jgi:hypothetical protein